MMFFLGDPHGHFSHVYPFLQKHAPTVAIFLGDLESDRDFMEEIAKFQRFGCQIWWIHGNHDTDSHESWSNLVGALGLSLDGIVVEIEGVRIAGLGGVFREEIWYPDTASPKGAEPHYANYDSYCQTLDADLRVRVSGRGSWSHAESNAQLDSSNPNWALDSVCLTKKLTHRSSIFWDTYARLWDQQADILVTHEAPSIHPHGFAAIDELAQSMGVHSVFHGHHHDCLDYQSQFQSLGFKAYGVGLRGIMTENGTLIRPGDRD
jgi:predicted phosphodiesterase